MKRNSLIPFLSIFFILLVSMPSFVNACEMDFKIIGEKKSVYRMGDEVIVKLTVFLTHRNCPEGIQSTKFKSNGMKILSATKWDEVSGGVWERKLKLKIEGTGKGNLTINATRTCDKEGGSATLKLSASTAK